MSTLNLTSEQHEVLLEFLESNLGDLRYEIASTDRKSFRDPLKRKEVVLKEIIAMLEEFSS